MMNLICGNCRHEAEFDAFCVTAVTGELPRGTHQCPACRVAWRMEKAGVGHYTRHGLFIPADTVIVRIPSML